MGYVTIVGEHYDIRELTGKLGVPHLQQITERGREGSCVLVHWGCGCTGIGRPTGRERGARLTWNRCDAHAEVVGSL